MNKILVNKRILIGVMMALVLVLILVGVFYFVLKSKSQLGESKEKSPEISTTGQDLSVSLEELKKLKVPEPSDLVQEQSLTTTATDSQKPIQSELAIPEEVVPVNTQSGINLRSFELNIKNNQVFPKEIRVYSGDVVDIDIKAIDKNYNLAIPAYGLSIQVNKGETKKIQFQATDAGKFIFECSLCSPKFTGLIMVVPR